MGERVTVESLRAEALGWRARMTGLRNMVDAQEKQIAELKREIEKLLEQIARLEKGKK